MSTKALMTSETPRHNTSRDFLVVLLWTYFKKNPIGRAISETDSLVNEDTIRRPDISVFLGDNAGRLDLDRSTVPFAPDIAVEVLSKYDTAVGLRRKVRDHFCAGGNEVWLLDHANGEVQVHTSAGIQILEGTALLESPLLPGFGIAVNELVNP